MIGGILDQRAAGGHQRHVDLQRLDQVQRVAVASAGGQHDVDSRLPGARPAPRAWRASARRGG